MNGFKDVVGFEGLYVVNEKGDIYSLKRHKKPYKIKPYKDRDGYLRVKLYNSKGKLWIGVHKVVAMAFISNPNNYTMVNHLNYMRDDNRIANLEWCDAKENAQWSIQHYKGSQHKAIICEGNDGGVEKFYSMSEASKAKQVNVANICRCCKGRTQRAGGYKWRYDGGMDI